MFFFRSCRKCCRKKKRDETGAVPARPSCSEVEPRQPSSPPRPEVAPAVAFTPEFPVEFSANHLVSDGSHTEEKPAVLRLEDCEGTLTVTLQTVEGSTLSSTTAVMLPPAADGVFQFLFLYGLGLYCGFCTKKRERDGERGGGRDGERGVFYLAHVVGVGSVEPAFLRHQTQRFFLTALDQERGQLVVGCRVGREECWRLSLPLEDNAWREWWNQMNSSGWLSQRECILSTYSLAPDGEYSTHSAGWIDGFLPRWFLYHTKPRTRAVTRCGPWEKVEEE